MLSKKLGWQDYVFCGIIILFLILTGSIVKEYESFPAPLYGGDYYVQLGQVNHVKDGGNPFSCQRTSDSVPNYFPVYATITGYTARFGGMSAMDAVFFMSVVSVLLSAVVIYLLGSRLFDKSIGLVLVLFFASTIPILYYSSFASSVTFPLIFIFVCNSFFREKTKFKTRVINSIITGILFGLLTLSHGTMLFSLSLFFGLLFLYEAVLKHLSLNRGFNKASFLKGIKHTILLFAIIFTIGILISLLYWLPVGLEFLKGESSYKTLLNMNTAEEQSFFGESFTPIVNIFFDFSSVEKALFSLGAILAMGFLFFLRKIPKKYKFSYFFVVATILIYPLLYIFLGLMGVKPAVYTSTLGKFWISMSSLLLFGLSLKLIMNLPKIKKYYLYIIIALLMIGTWSVYAQYTNHIDNQWYKNSKEPLPQYLTETAEYLKKNSDVNDVVLTNKELGMSINSLTGRKIVAYPVGHKSMVYDFNERERDLAIMLYGNNNEKRRELLNKYDVEYFYWDAYWLQSEFIQDESGQIAGYFDPIEILNTKENKRVLEENGVKFTEERLELNPNMRGKVTKFDVLLVHPNHNIMHPWNEALDEFLVLEKEVKSQGQTAARLYRVEI